MSQPVIQINSVSKSYGQAPALADISLSIQRGELFGLLGPNGAGKTTLMSILAGLFPPDRGDVRIFGKTYQENEYKIKHRVGIATQDLAVYPELTARENLAFFGQLYGLHGRELKERVEEVLDAVSLTDRADQRAATFSGGMKRRLNIAVAVVHQPRILLLDEPTTGVDPQSRNHIFERVRALNATGMTIIYSSHYMEEVQSLCSRIAILDHGKVLACDTLANLLRMLDDVIRIGIKLQPTGLIEKLGNVAGVKQVRLIEDGLELSSQELGPVLPRLITVLGEFGIEPTRFELDQVNLERIFLHLTGRGLRD